MKHKRKNDDKFRPALRWIVPVLLLTVAMGILLLATINEQSASLITPTPYIADMRYVPRTPTPNPITALPHDQCIYTETMQIQPRENFAAYETFYLPSPDEQDAIVREIGGGLYLTGVDGTRRYLTADYDTGSTIGRRIIWSPNSRGVAVLDQESSGQTHILVLNVENGSRRDLITTDTYYNQPGQWSADSNYWLEYGYNEIRVWDMTSMTPVYEAMITAQNIQWSSSGNTLAYIMRRDSNDFLVLRDIDSATQAEFPLEYNTSDYAFYWSPDGQRVALDRGNRWEGSEHIINFYGLDGTSEPYVGYTIVHYINNEWIPLTVQWLADGQHAITYREIENRYFQLVTYDVATNDSQVLFDYASRQPSFAPDSRHAMVYQVQGDGEVIQQVDTITGDVVPFIWYADDTSEPHWSPDGQSVAVVWAIGKGAARRLFLSWLDVNSGEVTTLDDGLWDVRHVYWMADGQHLLYEAVRSAGLRLEMVNTRTGETSVLIDSIAETDYYTYDTDTLTLWWQTTDGQSGRDVYGADGRRSERWLWQGVLPVNLREFTSPDGAVIAIKAGGDPFDRLSNDESLTLIYADGRAPVTVFTNLSGLSDPFWSPDGRLISVLTADDDVRAPTLQLYSADGDALWHYPDLPQWAGGFVWVTCD